MKTYIFFHIFSKILTPDYRPRQPNDAATRERIFRRRRNYRYVQSMAVFLADQIRRAYRTRRIVAWKLQISQHSASEGESDLIRRSSSLRRVRQELQERGRRRETIFIINSRGFDSSGERRLRIHRKPRAFRKLKLKQEQPSVLSEEIEDNSSFPIESSARTTIPSASSSSPLPTGATHTWDQSVSRRRRTSKHLKSLPTLISHIIKRARPNMRKKKTDPGKTRLPKPSGEFKPRELIRQIRKSLFINGIRKQITNSIVNNLETQLAGDKSQIHQGGRRKSKSSQIQLTRVERRKTIFIEVDLNQTLPESSPPCPPASPLHQTCSILPSISTPLSNDFSRASSPFDELDLRDVTLIPSDGFDEEDDKHVETIDIGDDREAPSSPVSFAFSPSPAIKVLEDHEYKDFEERQESDSNGPFSVASSLSSRSQSRSSLAGNDELNSVGNRGETDYLNLMSPAGSSPQRHLPEFSFQLTIPSTSSNTSVNSLNEECNNRMVNSEDRGIDISIEYQENILSANEVKDLQYDHPDSKTVPSQNISNTHATDVGGELQVSKNSITINNEIKLRFRTVLMEQRIKSEPIDTWEEIKEGEIVTQAKDKIDVQAYPLPYDVAVTIHENVLSADGNSCTCTSWQNHSDPICLVCRFFKVKVVGVSGNLLLGQLQGDDEDINKFKYVKYVTHHLETDVTAFSEHRHPFGQLCFVLKERLILMSLHDDTTRHAPQAGDVLHGNCQGFLGHPSVSHENIWMTGSQYPWIDDDGSFLIKSLAPVSTGIFVQAISNFPNIFIRDEDTIVSLDLTGRLTLRCWKKPAHLSFLPYPYMYIGEISTNCPTGPIIELIEQIRTPPVPQTLLPATTASPKGRPIPVINNGITIRLDNNAYNAIM